MQTKRLYPHFTETVKAFEFLNIPNPSSIVTYEDIIPYEEPSRYYDLVNPGPGITVEDSNGVLTVTIDKSEYPNLNFDWTSIVARSSDELSVDSYLSISYWENVITSDAPFEKLRISYSSSYIVVPSTDAVSVEVSYLQHDIYEGTSVDSSDKWKSHLNLYREVSGVLFPKTKWITESTSIDIHTSNQSPDVPLSTWDSSDTLGKNSIDINTNTQVLNIGKATYECIPTCESTAKLMVSPRYGVEFYVPSGNIINQSGVTNSAPPKPNGISQNDNFEIYRLYKNVFLFYVPEKYEAWVCYEALENSSIVWKTWKVGGESSESGETIKVVVPSYVDIIPFVFMQKTSGTNIGEWRISYVMRLCDSIDDLFATYSGTGSDYDTTPQQYPYDSSSRTAIPVEVFFKDIKYLTPYMEDISMGYTPEAKVDLNKYFYSQLYISFQTFIQSLRMNEFYGSNPQICDCGIKLGKFFIPYSQDIINDGNLSHRKNTSCAIEIGEGYSVDNMLAFLSGNLISLYSGLTRSVSQYTDVQMHHGIVVGWDGSEYVQLQ